MTARRSKLAQIVMNTFATLSAFDAQAARTWSAALIACLPMRRPSVALGASVGAAKRGGPHCVMIVRLFLANVSANLATREAGGERSMVPGPWEASPGNLYPRVSPGLWTSAEAAGLRSLGVPGPTAAQ